MVEPVVISSESRQQAEQLKSEANKCFSEQNYTRAMELYSRAIALCDDDPVFYGNRSICHLRQENFGLALQDAEAALARDPGYIKGFYRRAAANMALGKWKLALKDFEAVKMARPRSADALQKFNECQKMVRRIAFERAIAVEDSKSITESIDLESMVVEESYSGPRLDEEAGVTAQFMEQLLLWFKQQKVLHKKYAFKILLDVERYFSRQPSLVDIDLVSGAKFTVCGDIHGQFYDLLNIFHLNGVPAPHNPYLFNGDFVDRGSFSVECILTLFAFKLLYPDHFFMSRGNHESETMNQMYGFDGEVRAKYSAQMALLFTEVYNRLPLCHVIGGRVFVTHGGLPVSNQSRRAAENGAEVSLQDIRAVDRNRQPPDEGIMCDLLWADPQPQPGCDPSKRGVGCQFGPDMTERFLKHNQLDCVIRSHEVKPEGYEVAHEGRCITVFSAPNYCDTMGNKGAFITLEGGDLTPKYTTFEAVPHPSVQPMAYVSSLMNMLM